MISFNLGKVDREVQLDGLVRQHVLDNEHLMQNPLLFENLVRASFRRRKSKLLRHCQKKYTYTPIAFCVDLFFFDFLRISNQIGDL